MDITNIDLVPAELITLLVAGEEKLKSFQQKENENLSKVSNKWTNEWDQFDQDLLELIPSQIRTYTSTSRPSMPLHLDNKSKLEWYQSHHPIKTGGRSVLVCIPGFTQFYAEFELRMNQYILNSYHFPNDVYITDPELMLALARKRYLEEQETLAEEF